MQARSWAAGRGADDNPRLVGQIYFPRDDANLDPQDVGTLNRLVEEYRRVIVGYRVELLFAGHADHRASADYNVGLAMRRADAVSHFLRARLGRSPNYSGFRLLSFGERHARQAGASLAQMMGERRVDIVTTYLHPSRRRFVVDTPLRVTGAVPEVDRIVYREFSSHDAENMAHPAGPQGSSLAGEAIRSMVSALRGDEREHRRQTARFPVTHRVNRVAIDEHRDVRRDWPARVAIKHVEVRYEWGPPAPRVTVERTVLRELHINDRRVQHAEHSESYTVVRGEAEAHPLLFPPNP
ncbi:MAG: OmpA family protein [Sandaracinaceae bacterium]